MKKNFEKTFIPYLRSINLFRAICKIRGQLYLLKSLLTFRVVRVFRGKNFFRLLFIFLLPTSYFLLFSCASLTNPDKTTVSGVVKLEAQADHSGVKVSLYKLVDLDTTLVRINKQYPNIGIQISQETEFYHREKTPIYITTTNKAGKWKIKDIDKNKYNIVAEKAEYGFKYFLNQNVEQSIPTQNLNKVIDLNLISAVFLRQTTFTD